MGTHRVRQDRGIRGLDPRSRARNSVGEVIAPECHSINRMIVLAADNVVDAEHRSTPCSLVSIWRRNGRRGTRASGDLRQEPHKRSLSRLGTRRGTEVGN